jgi:hypothetical protein
MFHSKFSFLRYGLSFLLLVGAFAFTTPALAQDGASFSEGGKHRTLKRTTLALEYVSWEELLRIDSGTQLDNAYANFYGNALSIEREVYHSLRSGAAFSAAFLFGQANAGGTQTTLTYQTSTNKWYGGMATARYSYRLAPTINVSIGPMALVRRMSWPKEGTTYSLKSGSDFNLGLLGEVGAQLSRSLVARLEMGTLSFRATTYWSVGLGYMY